MLLQNKVAVITGGSLGLGLETAHLFVRQGATVVITGRTEKTLQDAVEAVRSGVDGGGTIDYYVANVSDEEACRSTVESVITKHGRIDILFNNAGVLRVYETAETPTDVWDETFAINVRGTFLMSKFTIPHMLERGKGCIINNSSILGSHAAPGCAAYIATKGAIAQLTRAMAVEYAARGIRTNAICPGTTVTPLVEDLFEQTDDPQAARRCGSPTTRWGVSESLPRSRRAFCSCATTRSNS